jgi:hypothetical protein
MIKLIKPVNTSREYTETDTLILCILYYTAMGYDECK